jgi:hypothetical protein
MGSNLSAREKVNSCHFPTSQGNDKARSTKHEQRGTEQKQRTTINYQRATTYRGTQTHNVEQNITLERLTHSLILSL